MARRRVARRRACIVGGFDRTRPTSARQRRASRGARTTTRKSWHRERGLATRSSSPTPCTRSAGRVPCRRRPARSAGARVVRSSRRARSARSSTRLRHAPPLALDLRAGDTRRAAEQRDARRSGCTRSMEDDRSRARCVLSPRCVRRRSREHDRGAGRPSRRSSPRTSPDEFEEPLLERYLAALGTSLGTILRGARRRGQSRSGRSRSSPGFPAEIRGVGSPPAGGARLGR